MFTIDQQINNLKFEIKRKKRVYPKLVEQGKLTDHDASYSLACLQKTIETLTQLKGMVQL